MELGFLAAITLFREEWLPAIARFLHYFWERAEAIFQQQGNLIWLAAIIIGFWCLAGYASRKNH